jgi:putative methionine-R-sulfoxide reductase with GAF domain
MEPAFVTTELLEQRGRLVTVDAEAARLLSCLESARRDGADQAVGMDELLASVADRARELVSADAATVAMFDGESLVCRARAGALAPVIGTPVNLRSRFTGESFRKQQTLYCQDTESDPRVNGIQCRDAGVRSIVAVPVVWRRRSIGIVEVFSGSPAPFGQNQVHALEMLADVLAEVVHARETGETTDVESIEAAAENWQPTEKKEEHRIEAEPRGRGRIGRYAWALLATGVVLCATAVFPGHQTRIAPRMAAGPSSSLQTVSRKSPVQPTGRLARCATQLTARPHKGDDRTRRNGEGERRSPYRSRAYLLRFFQHPRRG